MAAVDTKLQRALILLEQGDLAGTERQCRRILEKDPRQCEALHLLGLVALRSDRAGYGIDLIQRSLAINPRQPFARSNIGNALLGMNRPADALAQFDYALTLQPDLGVAHFNRGKALLALGSFEPALASFDRAIDCGLDDIETQEDRGKTLMLLGRYAQAVDAFDRALRIAPENADALNNRGNALLEMKRPAEAIDSIERALKLKPEFAEALNNLARALAELDRRDEALAAVDRALRLNPSMIEAFNNRGNLLLEAKEYDAAMASFDRALQLRYDAPETHNNRGSVFLAMRRHDDALSEFEHALGLKPDFPEALNNRGLALVELMRFDEALASYGRALDLDDGFSEAMENLGNALVQLMRYDEALAVFDRAVQLRADSAVTHFNRGMVLLDLGRHEEAAKSFAESARFEPDFDYARGYLLFSRLHICDWSHYEEDIVELLGRTDAGKRGGDPFQIAAVSQSPESSLRCARTFVADKYPAAEPGLRPDPHLAHDRIRVAYLSADFGEHAVSHVAAGLFERHDRSRFETLGIALRTEQRPSRMRQRLQQAFEQFHDVSAKIDREAAALLRDLEVDIAVDLNGHTSGGRPSILALRPAPVQVNYLGFPGTFGADYIDYIVADGVVIPAGEEPAYAEHVVRLPHSYLPYDNRLEVAADTPSRTEAGLPQSGFVFCAFNNGYKITPAVFDIWMRLLQRIPDSVLWLRATNPAMVRNLGGEAAARGVAPQRLVFAPRIDVMARHLARHRLAGVFLDTLPYNAHSTAADALWAGLPVLTCQGSTFAGRVAASLLRAVGLPELITHSLEEYEALAYSLATTPPMLADIRSRLAANRTTYPLFDTDRLRRHLESAYLTMWERNQRGERPQGFSIQAPDS